MKNFRVCLIIPVVLLFSIELISCKDKPSQSDTVSMKKNSETVQAYTDPFAYCSAVGNIDSPDSRYVGSKVPEVIASGLQKAFESPEGAPLDVFIRGTYWRCMDGKVYACNVGANLPCEEKADSSREPNQGIISYCESNPDSEFIPAYASGRATIYEWRCKGKEPIIVKEINKPDAAGYLSNIWYEITPN